MAHSIVHFRSFDVDGEWGHRYDGVVDNTKGKFFSLEEKKG